MDPAAMKPLGLALPGFLKGDKSASFTIITARWAHRNAPLRGREGTVQRNVCGSLRVSLNSPFAIPQERGA